MCIVIESPVSLYIASPDFTVPVELVELMIFCVSYKCGAGLSTLAFDVFYQKLESLV